MTDAFTPDTDFVDRALDAELDESSEAVDRKLRTLLAAIDDSLAGISDARKELRTICALPDVSAVAVVLTDEIYDKDSTTHLEDAARNLRAAAEILRSHRQLTSPPP